MRTSLYSLAAFASLAFSHAQAAEITAATTGNWSDTSTWFGGVQPGVEDDVIIPVGRTVTLNQNVECGGIVVEGKLTVERANRTLVCDSIMVQGAGAVFEVGTNADRFTQNFTLTLKGLASEGPMGGKSLSAQQRGTLEIHGRDRVEWTHLGVSAAAGATSLTLSEAVDWVVGDEILVTSSRASWNEAETLKITSVSGDGRTVSFATPLAYPHNGSQLTKTRPTNPYSDSRSWTADLRAEVGLLSRNVKIQGDAGSEGAGFGGHIMVMNMMPDSPQESGKAFIEGVELYRMGQKAIRGRYPMHWHMLADAGLGQYFRDSVVRHSFNRAIVIHGTESAQVENNFCYDHLGHGIFLENGSERFNIIRRNVVALSKKPKAGEELIETDNAFNEGQNRSPSSFWITNPNNTFEDNVAAGTEGVGYWFAFPQKPLASSLDVERFAGLEPHKQLLGKFDRNTAHSSRMGLDINDQVDANDKLLTNGEWAADGPFYFNDCTWYSNETAIYAGIGGARTNVVYKNNVFSDNGLNLFLATYQRCEESLMVADSGFGLQPAATERYVYAVYDGAGRMKNNHLVRYNASNANFFQNIGAATKHPNHEFEGLTFEPNVPVRSVLPNYNIISPGNIGANDPGHPRMWALVIRDVNGSISGRNNSSIVANHPWLLTGGETRPSAWTNTYSSPHQFAQVRLNYHQMNVNDYPKVSAVREKSDTPTAGVYYLNGYPDKLQLPLIVNGGFRYTFRYETLPANQRIYLDFDDAKVGNNVLLRFKGFGNLTGIGLTKMTSKGSLSELESSSTSGYFKETNGDFDLYVRPVATTTRQRYEMTWNGTNPTMPGIDSDLDDISDGAEAAAGTDPFRTVNGTDPFVPTEFAVNGDFEQWQNFTNIVNETVTNGVLTAQSSNLNAQLDLDNLRVSGTDAPYMLVRMRASANGAAKLSWRRLSVTDPTNPAQYTNYTSNSTVSATYNGGNQWRVLAFPMSPNTEWDGKVITNLRLNPVASAGTTFSIDWMRKSDGNFISTLAAQTTSEDTALANIPVTLSADTSDALFVLTGTSSNTALVPSANITFGGTGTARTVTVTPAANQSGNSTITLTVSDGSFTANTTFNFTVNAVNDVPTSAGGSVNLNATNSKTFSAGDFTFADADPGDTLGAIQVTSLPTNGTLTFNGTAISLGDSPNSNSVIAIADIGSLTYTVRTGYTVSDSFKFKVGDASLFSAEATMNITGTPASLSLVLTNANPTSSTTDYTTNTTGTITNTVTEAALNSLTIDTTAGANIWNLTSGKTATVTTGSLMMTGANDFTIQNGTLKSNSTSGLLFTQNGAGNLTVSSVIANGIGNSPLGKTGTGILTLAGNNTYTGETTIRGGILNLTNSLALQNSALDTTNSVTGTASAGLKTSLTSLTLGGLTGSKDLASIFTTLNGGYSSVGNLTLNPSTGFDNTYAGSISNGTVSMNLTKNGSGTQTLSGNSTLVGLKIDAGSMVLKSGTLNATGNGTFQLGSTTTSPSLTIDGGTLLTTGLTKLGGSAGVGVFTINNGTWTNTGGFITIMNGGNTGTGSVMNVNGGQVTSVNNSIELGQNAVNATLNLNGGTTTVRSLFNTNNSTAIVNLNGGTLKAAIASGNFTAISRNGAMTPLNVLAGGAVLDTNGFNISVLSPLVAGSPNGGFTKNGNGTLTLSGNNTYTGVTTINAGTLAVATIGDGGVLGNFGQATSAASNLVFAGGNLSYTGQTTSSNRSFTLIGTSNTTNTIHVSNSGTTLTLNGTSPSIVSTNNSSSGLLQKTGNGTLVLDPGASGNYTLGSLTANGGNLTLKSGNFTTTGRDMTPSGTLYNFAIGAGARNGGTLVVDGAKLTVSTGSNLKVGASTTGNGNLRIVSGTVTAPDIVVGHHGSSVATQSGGDVTTTNLYHYDGGTGSYTMTGGNLTVRRIYNFTAGNETFTFSMDGGTVRAAVGTGNLFDNAARGPEVAVQLGSTNGGATIDTSSSSATIQRPLVNMSGQNGTLTKIGTNTLILNATNIYTGITTVSAGTLQINGTNSGSGAVNIASGASLGGTGSVSGHVIVASGGFVAPGAGGIGTLTLASATLSGTYQCELGATTGDLLAVQALTVDSSTNIVFSGDPTADEYTIATYGNMIGTLPAITPPNDFRLDTATPGVIRLVRNSSSLLSDTSLISPPSSSTDYLINTPGTITNNVTLAELNSLFIKTATGASVWNLGADKTAVINSGYLTMTGANNFTIQNGTLKSGANSGFPNSRLVFTQDGTGNFTVSSVIANGIGNSTLTKAGSGTLTLAGANTYTGETTISGGILNLTNSLALQNSPLNTSSSVWGSATAGLKTTVSTLTLGGLTGNKNFASLFTTNVGGYIGVTALTLNLGDGVDNTYLGIIANGAVGMRLIKSGNGTLTLQGNNTYTGNTTISSGILSVAEDRNLGSSGGIVLAGGTLQTVGEDAFSTTRAVSLLANSTIDVSNIVAATTLNGPITGSANLTLTKTGSGTLALSGNNTSYTSTTIVSGGFLAVNGTSIADSGRLVISGGKVNLTGNETVGTLYFNRSPQSGNNATYNATNSSAYFTGTGNLRVTGTGAALIAATPQSVTVLKNTEKGIDLTSTLGGNKTYTIVSQPANGMLTGTPPNMTYRPSGNYTGPDRFTFKVNNGDLDSLPATVTITVEESGGIVGTGGTTGNYTAGGTNYKVHTFTSNGTFTVVNGGNVRYLVVGGGGGGGGASSSGATGPGGGGGAGGFLTGNLTIAPGNYTVTVGAGGAAGTSNATVTLVTGGNASNGQNSVFGTITAIGGGGGGTTVTGVGPGIGGSGGGGSGSTNATGAIGTAEQGTQGGNFTYAYTGYPAGGGGGAGAAGNNPSDANRGGNGGNGLTSNITGNATWYAGGGGGATGTNAVNSLGAAQSGLGGDGGGGKGGVRNTSIQEYLNGGNGAANTGGGGGGATRSDYKAGAGGSGIVIISYAIIPTPTITSSGNLTTPLSTTYGTASNSGNFTVTGSNMTTGIVVTAPTGLEVSLASSSGYAPSISITVGAAGTIARTSVYVRLAATARASGSYNSRKIVLSSSGASPVNVLTSPDGNMVQRKPLTITAQNRNKGYGAVQDSLVTVSSESSQASQFFTAAGLVNNETVAVTMAYSNGALQATDTVGSSSTITPSVAVGGTLLPADYNYAINYVPATLTVVGPPSVSYTEWAATNGVTGAAAADANQDGVPNGIAYFVGETGRITLPRIDGYTVTWGNGGNIPSSAYGSKFFVETSSDLVTWTVVGASDLKSNTATEVSYTIPSGTGKTFVRLKVIAD